MGGPEGQIDAFSHGFGVSDALATPTQGGAGTLTGGNLGTLAYTSQSRTWGPTQPGPTADQIDLNATNIAAAAIDVSRAHVDCKVDVRIQSDGPITVTLPGCNRTIQAG